MTQIIPTDKTVFWTARDAGNLVHSGETPLSAVTATSRDVATAETEDEFLGLIQSDSASFPPLPNQGEFVEEGYLYSYNDGVLKARQSHIRTEHDPNAVPALFITYRADGANLDWIANEQVSFGTIRAYGGDRWIVIQSHVTQAGWEPPNVPALWEEYIEQGGSEWIDSGETVVSLVGAGVIQVTDTAPFSASMQIRINGTEATVTSIFTSGAPGILVISPHIAVSGGEMIEIFS